MGKYNAMANCCNDEVTENDPRFWEILYHKYKNKTHKNKYSCNALNSTM